MGFLSSPSPKARAAIALLAFLLSFLLTMAGTGNWGLAATLALFIPATMLIISAASIWPQAAPFVEPAKPEPRHFREQLEYFLWKLRILLFFLFYPAAYSILLESLGDKTSVFETFRTVAGVVIAIPHEIGHFIFHLVPRGPDPHFIFFIGTMAGTLGYTLPPILLAVYYFRKKDALATGAAIAFLAVSFAHMSWYVAETQSQVDRYGGPDDLDRRGSHYDWYMMLTYLDSLDSADALSAIFQSVASFLATVSFAFLLAWAYLFIKEALQKSGGAPPPAGAAR